MTLEGSFPEVAVGSVRPAGASLCEGSEVSYSRKARFARSCSVHVTFVRKDQMRLQIVLRVCDPKTGPGMWNNSTYILLICSRRHKMGVILPQKTSSITCFYNVFNRIFYILETQSATNGRKSPPSLSPCTLRYPLVTKTWAM